MKLLNRLERKFGRYAIPNLMLYIVLGMAAVYLVCMFNMNFVQYLFLSPQAVLAGQVWRLITFVFIPTSVSYTQLFMVAISLYFYYFIGKMMENRWGAFRFNVYYFLGMICTIVFSMVSSQPAVNYFLNESLFLAFAASFPEVQVLLFFIIPLKVKYLGYFSAALLLYQFITGSLSTRLMILASLTNFLIFFGPEMVSKIRLLIQSLKAKKKFNAGGADRIFPAGNAGGSDRSSGFSRPNGYGRTGGTARQASAQAKVVRAAFHRCCVCGKTELDDPQMEFRYCSQCGTPAEYCMDHLYNHEHLPGKTPEES